ncbi:MAG: hypothetical protein ACR2QM_13460 [Longimicrobiales bacterium]
MNTPPPGSPAQTPRSSTLEKVGHLLGVFFATFEAITIHATLAGHRPLGAIQALAVLGLALFILFSRIQSSEARRRVLARVAVTVSAAAVVCALVLTGKMVELGGVSATSQPLLRTVLLLLFQLGWAISFWLTVAKRADGQARYIPAAIGVTVLIVGGLLADGESGQAPVEETTGVVFKQFATGEDYAFARETMRVGKESGSAFAHYHTGRQPLIGVSFDTTDWFGQARISNLSGLFEGAAEAEGAHRIQAPPGYVVASVEIQADDHVNAIRLEFAPFDGEYLLPDGWYWTEWAGGYEQHGPKTRLHGGTELVVGLRGTAGMVLNSLSLLAANPTG